MDVSRPASCIDEMKIVRRNITVACTRAPINSRYLIKVGGDRIVLRRSIHFYLALYNDRIPRLPLKP